MKNFLLAIIIITTCVFNINAQNSVEEMAKKALIIGRTLQQEHVYLQFDNTVYYLGETIWFKAYTTYSNRDYNSNLSKVLYVELVAPEGYVVETKKYKLDDNGCCNGDFELKTQLLSGYYEVRAYTRYMLNRGNEAVFSRVFPVFDKVNKNNWDFKNLLDRQRGFTKENDKKDEVKLLFFPEGGHLVNDIKSCIAYELRNEKGDFSNDTITIYKNNNILLKTTPVHNGKNSFYITPDINAEYSVKVSAKNNKGKTEEYKFELPEIEETGVVTHITQNIDSVYIDIKNNYTDNIELGFVILHRGSIGYYNRFMSEEKQKTFKIAKNNLPEGVCGVVVFNNDIPLVERLLFIEHNEIQKGDRETVKLKAKINNRNYTDFTAQPHEKFNISIEREDGKPINKNAEFAVSVTDAAGNQTTSWDYNIYTYLLLGSELKGYIPNASQYFDKSNEKRKENLDLLMLTHGWTAYNWKLLNNIDINNIQPVEKELILKGALYRVVKNGSSGKHKFINEAYNPIRLDIAYMGDSISTNVFRTDSMGKFTIAFDDFYGKKVAYLSPKVIAKFNDNIKYTFSLDRYFSPKPNEIDYWERNIGKPIEYENKNNINKELITKISPLEYLLGDVEIIEKRKKDIFNRPPLCEIKFNYLDEWEYAKDVTYFKGNEFNALAYEDFEEEEIRRDKLNEIADAEIAQKDTAIFIDDEITMYDRMPEFKDVITANNVLRSIFKRYNLPWCFWIHSIVPVGEYNSNSVPVEDKEYLYGKDAEKMTNFKDIILRSDEKICNSINNTGEGFWKFKNNALTSKRVHSEFYEGFLSPTTIYPIPDKYYNLHKRIKSSMRHPNYVACFIPFKKDEKREGIIPEFTNSYSMNRYTSVQGYTESKKFYSPDYSNIVPNESNDYRRTLLWEPNVTIKDGKIILEMYNSSSCEYINIYVNGKDNRTYYSNDYITETRISDFNYDSEEKEEKFNKKIDNVVDSVALAQYEEEYKMGITYYNMKKYLYAVKIFSELQQYNYIPAIRSIGYCYLHGNGLKKSESLATEFFLRASNLGDGESTYELAQLYKKKDSINNKDIIIELIKKAAEQDEPRAYIDLGKYYIAENGDSVKGIYYYRLSAIKNNSEGEYLYAKYMLEKSIEKDEELGTPIELIIKSAKKECIDAMIYLMQYNDKNKNYKEAYNWAKKLHILKNREGTAYMAHCYENGLGVKKDKRLSKDLYRTIK